MAFLNVNGVKIYYEQFGSGEAVVLLHSLGTSSSIWKKQIEKLKKNNYQVIVVDARGHGETELSSPFSFYDWANDIICILDTLEVDKAHFIGTSMGGHVVFELFQIAPKR